MTTFIDFIPTYTFKSEATTILKIQQVLFLLFHIPGIAICLRDGPIKSIVGKANLHPTKGTRGVAYIDQIYCKSNGGPPPEKLTKCTITQNG